MPTIRRAVADSKALTFAEKIRLRTALDNIAADIGREPQMPVLDAFGWRGTDQGWNYWAHLHILFNGLDNRDRTLPQYDFPDWMEIRDE